MKIARKISYILFTIMIFTFFTNQVQAMNINDINQKQQAIVIISAFAADGNLEKLKPALQDGLNAGLSINEINEVLVQLYAYAGFPRSLNALNTFMTLINERQEKGLKDEIGKQATPMPKDANSLMIGTTNQTKLVGQAVTGSLFDFAPAIDQFLKAHLFGDIFYRDNLDWQNRELATIAILASISGLNSQLQSHFNMGMNTGLTAEQLKAVTIVLKEKVNNEFGVNAAQVLEATLNSRKK